MAWVRFDRLSGAFAYRPVRNILTPTPDDLQLAPLLHAAQSRFITVIAGITLQQHGQRQKGLALFTPNLSTIRRYPQGNGAGVIPRR